MGERGSQAGFAQKPETGVNPPRPSLPPASKPFPEQTLVLTGLRTLLRQDSERCSCSSFILISVASGALAWELNQAPLVQGSLCSQD